MTTVSPDAIEKLHARVTETALDVASLKATMDATLKQTDKVVVLLQGNGQRGLVKNVEEVKVKVRQCEEELTSRRLNSQHNRRSTIGWAVGIMLAIITPVLGFLFHLLSH